MVRPTQGYLAADGQFFATAEQAELYEATNELIGLCETHRFMYQQVLGLVDAAPDTFLRYVYAKKDIVDTSGQEAEQGSIDDTGDEQDPTGSEQDDNPDGTTSDSDWTEINWDKARNSIAKGTTKTVQQQPNDGRKPVPNVGSDT